jgi:hypothetical protein
MSFTCSSGNFQHRYNDCIGEVLMNMVNKGAVAFIGSTELALLDVNLELNLHIMEVLERFENISLGEALFYARQLAGASYKYNYLGDPAMSISGIVQANTLVPDLSLQPTDLRFIPLANSSTLSAIIWNRGTVQADNVLVRFYYSNPPAEDILINELLLNFIGPNGRSKKAIVNSDLKFERGARILVKVDEPNLITELNATNNSASIHLLPDLAISIKDVEIATSAFPEYPDTLKATIFNLGFFKVNDVLIQTFDESTGGPIQIGENIVIDVVKGGGQYFNVLKLIDFLEDKKVLIHVVVDPFNTIKELDEENNSAETLSIRSVFNPAEEFSNTSFHSYSAMGDFNNDDFIDLLVFSNESVSIYQNDQNNTFSLLEEKAKKTDPSGIYAPTFVDFNNDNKLDVYLSDRNFYKNSLTKELDNAIFYDTMANQLWSGSVLSFMDANGDGRLDILSCYYSPLANNREFNEQLLAQRFLLQIGNNIYSDITQKAGLYPKKDPAMGGSVSAVGDIDNDGDLDIFLAVNNTFNRVNYKWQHLYANNGDGTFVNKTQIAGLPEQIENVVTKAEFADYDNDGDMDLILGGQFPNLLIYQNNKNGTFSEIATSINLTNKGFQTVVDYDNDGYLDLYFSTHEDSEHSWLFYRNNKAGGFEIDDEASRSNGKIPHTLSSAFGDYNRDGFVDMLCTYRYANSILYQNYGNSYNWLHINLNGVESNSFGIGARVQVVADDLVQTKDMLCQVDLNQKIQHSQTLEFGLGDRNTIDSVLVYWPSGKETILANVKVNSTLNISENNVDETGPEFYSLFQNYPNPFNFSTTIKYQLPKSGFVRIDVYDILGRHVKTLVETRKNVGSFVTFWDGLDHVNIPVAAGVYFCRIKVGEYKSVFKMAFVK